MSIRVSALVAVVAVLALGSITPAPAQPVVPVRPRYSSFGGIFGSNNPAAPGGVFGGPGLGVGFGQAGMVNPVFANPGLGFGPLGSGFFYPGQTAFPQVFPGAFGVNPLLTPTGVVGTFNNLGHWYGPRAGYYGHWYPNGVTSGVGVLSNASSYGGGAVSGYALPVGGLSGGPGGMTRPGGGQLMGNNPQMRGGPNQLRR